MPVSLGERASCVLPMLAGRPPVIRTQEPPPSVDFFTMSELRPPVVVYRVRGFNGLTRMQFAYVPLDVEVQLPPAFVDLNTPADPEM
jgi:hypothetical protein